MGWPYSWKEIYRFSLFYLVFEGNFQVQAPGGAYIWRGVLTEGFLRYEFGVLYLGGLIHGGAYFRNFTVFYRNLALLHLRVLSLPFIVLLQNKHITLAENAENLINAQPRISTHS